jgi:BMFP domain-containing protein YqiC
METNNGNKENKPKQNFPFRVFFSVVVVERERFEVQVRVLLPMS